MKDIDVDIKFRDLYVRFYCFLMLEKVKNNYIIILFEKVNNF